MIEGDKTHVGIIPVLTDSSSTVSDFYVNKTNKKVKEGKYYGYRVVKGEELKSLRQTGCLPQIGKKTKIKKYVR